jgi:hypothetical protein
MHTLLIISLLLSSGALEQEEHGPLEQDQIRQRIALAQELLEKELPPTRQWFNILRSVYGGAAAVNAVLAFVDEEGKVAHITQASKASLGLIQALLDPYVPTYASKELSAMPQTTEEEKKAKLTQAEALLEKGARQAVHRLSWKGRILPTILHILGGLVIWRYQESWERGLISTVIGQTVTEITARTQPSGVIKAWETYQNKFLRSDALPQEPEVSFFILPTPLGFQTGFHF